MQTKAQRGKATYPKSHSRRATKVSTCYRLSRSHWVRLCVTEGLRGLLGPWGVEAGGPGDACRARFWEADREVTLRTSPSLTQFAGSGLLAEVDLHEGGVYLISVASFWGGNTVKWAGWPETMPVASAPVPQGLPVPWALSP